MLKMYIKCLLVAFCLPYVFTGQASKDGSTIVLYKGKPAYPGMGESFRKSQGKPSLFQTYSFPALTGAFASLAGAGRQLHDTHNFGPYLMWGGGTMATALFAQKLWNLSQKVHSNDIRKSYVPLSAGAVTGVLAGSLLAKLLQNRQWNPYTVAAVAGAGALCGVGAQYYMHDWFPAEQTVASKRTPLHQEASQYSQPNELFEQFIKDMKAGQSKEDDNPQRVAVWRSQALQELDSSLTPRQKKLLQRAYNKKHIDDILLNKVSDNDRSELDPQSLKLWLMWASDYYKTVSDDGEWLETVKSDLHKNKLQWFKEDSDVFDFIDALQDPQPLNDIISREKISFKSTDFFNAIRATDAFTSWRESGRLKILLLLLLGDEAHSAVDQRSRILFSVLSQDRKKEYFMDVIEPLSYSDADKYKKLKDKVEKLDVSPSDCSLDDALRDLIYEFYQAKSMKQEKGRLAKKLLTGLEANLRKLDDMQSGTDSNARKEYELRSIIRLLFTRIYELERPKEFNNLLSDLVTMHDVKDFKALYQKLKSALTADL